MKYLILAVFLAGCVVKVEDTRITREELTKAFSERDENILVLAQKIVELEKEKKK